MAEKGNNALLLIYEFDDRGWRKALWKHKGSYSRKQKRV